MPKALKEQIKDVRVEQRTSKKNEPYYVLVLEFNFNDTAYKVENYLNNDQLMILSLITK